MSHFTLTLFIFRRGIIAKCYNQRKNNRIIFSQKYYMNFFNSQTANIVQLISFPLEVIGLTLVVLEIYFPRKSSLIEYWINLFERRTRLKPEQIKPSVVLFIGFILLDAHVLSFEVISIFGELILRVFRNPNFDDIFSIFFCGVFLFPFIIIGVYFMFSILSVSISIVNIVIKGLNKLTKGRALASIGLILSCLGVMGELYQVICIFIGE